MTKINDLDIFLYEIYQNIINNNVSTLPNYITDKFKNSIQCYKLKAPSNSKSDITIKVYDIYTCCNQILDFSIKSQIDSASTLLNATNATNFVYKINGNITCNIINKFNNTEKFSEKFKLLSDNNIDFSFEKILKENFNNNICLIDMKMPNILSDMLILYYNNHKNNTVLNDNLKNVIAKNPLGLKEEFAEVFYSYKIKEFLMSVALGMKPSKTWLGNYEANGGYIIVKEDGEILCYHIYNRNDLKEYLYNNTKLDTGSTSKHNFGKIYKENDNYFFNLNLQIRFTK